MGPVQFRHSVAICAFLAAAACRAEVMPERVILSTEHGFVTRAGPLFRFEFDGAPLSEMAAAVSRVFLVLVACPDGGSGRFKASVLAHNPGEGLARIAGIAGCRVRGDGAVWVVERPGDEPLRGAALPNSCSGPAAPRP